MFALIQGWTVYAPADAEASRIPIEVSLWQGGDDGVTLRYLDALKIAVSQHSSVKLSESADWPLQLLVPAKITPGEKPHLFHTRLELRLNDHTTTDDYLWKWSGACDERDFQPCLKSALTSLSDYFGKR